MVENERFFQPKVKIATQPFQLDYKTRKQFQYSENPISISEITRRINALIPIEEMQKLSYKQIKDWPVESDFLVGITKMSRKIIRSPSCDGAKLNIAIDHRENPKGSYSVIECDLKVQKFILDNLDGIFGQMQR